MFGYLPARSWFGRPMRGFIPIASALTAPYGAPYPYVPYAPVWGPRFGRCFGGWRFGRGRGRGRGWGMWGTPFGWW